MTTPREDIAAMLRAGATHQQIITTLHVSPNTITATRRALDIPLPPGRGGRGYPAQPSREDIAAMLRQGATYAEIRDKLGVSNRTIIKTREAFDIPLPKGPGRRYAPEQRQAYERAAVRLLRQGATYAAIAAEVGISSNLISRIRHLHGIPLPERIAPSRSRTDVFTLHTEPYGDGHVRWNGSWAGRMPEMYAEGRHLNARHVSFQLHHQRPHTGYVKPGCTEPQCIAGAHLTDKTIRDTNHTNHRQRSAP